MAEKIFNCTDCGAEVYDNEPHVTWNGGEHLCLDCALKRGVAGPLYWLDMHGFGIYHHATYKDGVITAYQKWGKGYRKDEIKIE